MAYYAALASLVQLFEDIDRYPNIVRGRQKIFQSLHRKFVSLEEVLQDYSSKGNEADDHLQRKIREVSYRAQDAIESRIYAKETTYLHIKVFYWVISACQNALCWQLESCDIDGVLMKTEEEVDLIVKEVMAIIESQRTEDSQLDSYSFDTNSSTEVPVGDNSVIGFDEHLMSIKDRLCQPSTPLQIIPIVGMGGIGKTTLARNIFNDADVVQSFYCHFWVAVSQNYYVVKLLQSMVKSLSEKMEGLDGGEEWKLREGVYKYLKGRTYLIVLDDVWSTKVLDDIKHIFPNDKNGSRIIVTTRSWDVANYVGTHVHQIGLLNYQYSWNLFQTKLFGNEYCPEDLENIGKSIVSQCGGLPLAIVLIAGILSNKRTQTHWMNVASNVSKTLNNTNEVFSAVLSLSYHHLSHQLKPCFLLMGNFPEDYEIDVFELRQMWIAEGFLKLKEGCEALEQVAEECVDNLVKRNLVMITKKRKNGQFLSCMMHDLVREFCRGRAFSEHFFDVEQEGYSHLGEVDQVRRINLNWKPHNEIYLYNIGSLVRSILSFGRARLYHEYGTVIWDRCRRLRLLHMPDTRMWPIPDGIFQMFYLKYFSLYVLAEHLPRSIAMLQNLQTLIVDVGTTSYVNLPPEIWTMTQLRHCLISAGMFLPPVSLFRCITTPKLENLQTLMEVVDFRFTSYGIKMIPNIKRLGIRYREYSYGGGTWERNCLNNLVHFLRLEELSVHFAAHYGCVASFPISFAFPANLRDLTLSGCRLPWEDAAVIGSLTYLHVLRLSTSAFVGETWEPNEGEFLKLKFLLMEWLDLKCWLADSSHFPCLEHLEINACHELEEIPLDLGNILTLKDIHVYATERAGKSAVEIREDQKGYENAINVEVHKNPRPRK